MMTAVWQVAVVVAVAAVVAVVFDVTVADDDVT